MVSQWGLDISQSLAISYTNKPVVHRWESCIQSYLYSSQCLISKVESLYIMHCFPFSSYITCNGTPEFELKKVTWPPPSRPSHIIAVGLSTAISPVRISKDCRLLTYDRTLFFYFYVCSYSPFMLLLSSWKLDVQTRLCMNQKRKKTKKHIQEEEKWKIFLTIHVFPFFVVYLVNLFSSVLFF